MKEPLDSPPGSAVLGKQIPDVQHALSVSLPTWHDNVGWASGDASVVDVMNTGYPRFFVHRSILRLAQLCLAALQNVADKAMLFPTYRAAEECSKYMRRLASQDVSPSVINISRLEVRGTIKRLQGSNVDVVMEVNTVLFPPDLWKLAKSFWQHAGMGISSRYADRILELIQGGSTLDPHPPDSRDILNDYPMAPCEKATLRSRIADLVNGYPENLVTSSGEHSEIITHRLTSQNDVYLYPTGMSAIWHSHQLSLKFKPGKKCVCFGFSYTDTIKVLERWGPGSVTFFEGPDANLEALEQFLRSTCWEKQASNTTAEQNESPQAVAALFCEFPSNPLLQSPNLPRLRELADKYRFLIIIDETVGGFVNVDVLQYADIISTSMSKLFSGGANVMGGSLVLNSKSSHYDFMKRHLEETFVDDYYFEDAKIMEINSRDFAARVDVINRNANLVCEYLRKRSRASNPTAANEGLVVKEIFYPKWITRKNYDLCRRNRAENEFGPLFSLTFTSAEASHAFYDALKCAKGPSLGTNFTLSCPYTILAHYNERPWAAEYGIEEGIVRISVGMEDTSTLMEWIEVAATAAENTGCNVNQNLDCQGFH